MTIRSQKVTFTLPLLEKKLLKLQLSELFKKTAAQQKAWFPSYIDLKSAFFRDGALIPLRPM
jgi:hypothetical protein